MNRMHARGMASMDLVGISEFPNEHRILQKNDENNNKDEPVTDLRLSLGSGFQRTLRKSNNDSGAGAGAGANAGYKAEMMFPTTNTLFELVWSPHKGLILKCADKKSSLLYDVGSNDMVHMAPHSVCETSERVKLVRSPTRTIGVMPISQTTSHEHHRGSSGGTKELITKIDSNPEDTTPNLPEKAPMLDADKVRTVDSSLIKMDEPKLDLGFVEPECGEFNERLASVLKEDCKNSMTTIGLTNIPLLERQESTAENDLQNLKGEGASCLEVGMIIASKSADEVKRSPCWTEGIEASPNKSIIPFYQSKNQEMGFSNAKVNGKTLKSEDDFHESIESSSNTGLFLTRKRPCSFEKKLIIGNKKMKKEKLDYESHLSPSFHRQASSFKNWISNMVKGLSKSNLDETPSLAFTMSCLHGKNQKSGCTHMGFKTIFKALHCLNTSVQDGKLFLLDHQASEGSRELDKLSERIIIPNDKFNQGKSGDGEGPSALPNVAFANTSVLQENQKTGTPENNNLCNIARGLEKDGIISPKYSFQNGSDSPCEGKNTYELGSIDQNKSLKPVTNRSSPRSLWITRFSQKVSRSQNCDVSVKDPDIFRNGHKRCTEVRMDTASTKKFKSRLNPIQPSQRFKNSEAMTSVFAKRLDALKHILPSEVDGNTSHATMTCCFCGKRGHKLRDCLKITESEIEHLRKKIILYDGAIACPNTSLKKRRSHSDGNSSLVNFRMFGKMLHIPGKDTLANNDGRNPFEDKDSGCQIAHTFCNGKKQRADREVTVGTNIKKDLLGIDFCEGTSLKDSSSELKLNGNQTVSSSTEHESKENRITAFCNFVCRQIPTVPRGTFEAIKRLRLSRTDILKWYKSPMSLFCLEGFFLRVRLQNWEGLGGTGYYVASINGDLRERSSGNSKIPLYVNIGGFKCSIESRYVSNRDFVEDELMAWWCATLKGGAKLPSEEYLKIKLEERENFGF